jgi:hypothetical protein
LVTQGHILEKQIAPRLQEGCGEAKHESKPAKHASEDPEKFAGSREFSSRTGLLPTTGEWVFRYSDEFCRQSEIRPIVDFPDLRKEYRSRTLWPFFALRIPSPEQPAVRDFILKRKKADEGILLKEFGERSIANPFRLVPV